MKVKSRRCRGSRKLKLVMPLSRNSLCYLFSLSLWGRSPGLRRNFFVNYQVIPMWDLELITTGVCGLAIAFFMQKQYN